MHSVRDHTHSRSVTRMLTVPNAEINAPFKS